MKYPKISVCVLTFNSAKSIKRCIKNICHQNYAGEVEIIVHDDASADDTLMVLSKIQIPEKVSLLVIKKKQNTYATGYRAIWDDVLRRSSGQYICLCDGDDYWSNKDKITLQVNYLEQNAELDLVAGITQFVDLSTNTKVCFPRNIMNSSEGYIEAKDLFKMTQYVHTSSMMFRRRLLDILPTSKIKYLTNGDLIIQCLASIRSGKIGIINTNMSVYESNHKGLYSGIAQHQRDKNYIRTWSYLKRHPIIFTSKYLLISKVQFSFFQTKYYLKKSELNKLKLIHLYRFTIGISYRFINRLFD